jgi:trehalose-phosphatase
VCEDFDVTTPRVTVDPRLHDAVIFVVPQSNSMAELARRLGDAGVETASAEGADTAGLRETAQRIGARAERSVVVDDDADGIVAARNGGFSLVIGLAPAERGGELLQHGADVVVDDLGAVEVRTGDRRMSEIPDALDSYGDVTAILDGQRPAVCLDFDGTLSPIVPDPDSAQLVDGAAEALARLAERCPVAILSGRDLADIRDRVGVANLWYAGSHGFESIAPDGSYRQNDDAAAAVPVLEAAAKELRETLAHIKGTRVEHKRFAVAVHYRDVAADDIGEVAASTHRVGRREHLRVTNGRKVVELRPDLDWNKGTTLSWIREQITRAAGPATSVRPPEKVLPIYIGDDLTDEDGFLVRHTADGDRPSAARFTLENPERVREFLDRIRQDS